MNITEEIELLTIQEAAELFSLNFSTLYKRIQRGHLNYIEIPINGKKVKKVRKSDLIECYGMPVKEVQMKELEENLKELENQKSSNDGNGKNNKIQITSTEDIRQEMKAVIEEYFQDRETKLMRPIEEMAVYKVGKLEERVANLEKEKEIILRENEVLREAMKALPGPVEEVAEKLQRLEQQKAVISSLEEERQILQSEKEQAIQHIQDTTEALQEKDRVLADRENTVQTLKHQAEELKKEKERLLSESKQTEDLLADKEKEAAELQVLKEKAEQEEKDLHATIEELKKRLEEEQRKPWWKRIWQ